MDFDEEPDGMVEHLDDVFDEGHYANLSHTTFGEQIFRAFATVDEAFDQLTPHPHIREAVRSATLLRNVMGDSDAQAADHAENIRTSLMVFAVEMRKDPSAAIISLTKAMDDDEAHLFILQTIKNLIVHAETMIGSEKEHHDHDTRHDSPSREAVLASLSSL